MKSGMKHTIIGEIPADWEVVRLGDLCERITKGTTPTTMGYKYQSEGISFVKIESIGANGSIIPRMVAFINEEAHLALERSQLKKNDILFSIAGALGRTAIVDDTILPANTNQALAIIRLQHKAQVKYVYHYLRSDFVTSVIQKINVQTAQANLSLGDMQKFYVPLPPLSEQQKIAEILSTVDEKMAVMDEQLAQTQELKKGLMQRLLTKGIGHTAYKESPLGQIPESWEIKSLGELAEKISDGIHSTPQYISDSQYYFINGNNLVDGVIRIGSNPKCVSEEEFIKHRKDLNERTVLMSINGTIGNLAFYKGETVVLGKSAAYIKCKQSFNVSFLYYLLQSDVVKSYFHKELTGTTIKNLSLKTIKTALVAVPKAEEQHQIARILTTVDEKLQVLTDKKAQYQELKRGLMQQLLTGQRRVRVVAETATV